MHPDKVYYIYKGNVYSQRKHTKMLSDITVKFREGCWDHLYDREGTKIYLMSHDHNIVLWRWLWLGVFMLYL